MNFITTYWVLPQIAFTCIAYLTWTYYWLEWRLPVSGMTVLIEDYVAYKGQHIPLESC
jgi:hypothetical protein